ncbi:hypothetical protein XENTR_v10016193 [Xenopus tropicalis]|nr:hypothetical protein XENTR_v10016193 [Xenopus tropicalis]
MLTWEPNDCCLSVTFISDYSRIKRTQPSNNSEIKLLLKKSITVKLWGKTILKPINGDGGLLMSPAKKNLSPTC